MKIAVILGSPCGATSVTLQYVEFVRRHLREHELELHDVGRSIHSLERSTERFAALLEAIGAADGVLWAFPVYTMLTPASLVRFVELLFERDGPAALAGKPCTVLTTSEHFFDHTAHSYLEAISEDLGMAVFPGFSAEMEELYAPTGRSNLLAWAQEFLRVVEHDVPLEQHHQPVSWSPPEYRPALTPCQPAAGSLRIALITDVREGESNLLRMIETFRHHCGHVVDVVNLHEIGMKGSCLGCLRCVYDGSCVYKDGFAEAFDQRIQAADALLFACTLRHRYLSATFKTYFDRNFKNGHRPVLHGKPAGWLLSGPLRQMPNLRRMLEAKLEVQHSPRLGIVTDEYRDSMAISARIVELAQAVDRWSREPWSRPLSFPGVGGRKIFRDLMWSLRGLVRADHSYYRRKGLYDFPQRDHGRTLFNWMLAVMMALPWSRRWLMGKLGELKITKLRQLVEQQAPRA